MTSISEYWWMSRPLGLHCCPVYWPAGPSTGRPSWYRRAENREGISSASDGFRTDSGNCKGNVLALGLIQVRPSVVRRLLACLYHDCLLVLDFLRGDRSSDVRVIETIRGFLGHICGGTRFILGPGVMSRA